MKKLCFRLNFHLEQRSKEIRYLSERCTAETSIRAILGVLGAAGRFSAIFSCLLHNFYKYFVFSLYVDTDLILSCDANQVWSKLALLKKILILIQSSRGNIIKQANCFSMTDLKDSWILKINHRQRRSPYSSLPSLSSRPQQPGDTGVNHCGRVTAKCAIYRPCDPWSIFKAPEGMTALTL